MAKLAVGQKCVITEDLQPFVVSFHRANIVCKKKHKKYLGQSAEVLSLYKDGTVMLKMDDGVVFKFPSGAIRRAETNGDELNRNRIMRGHYKKHESQAERAFGDKFNSSKSRDEIRYQEVNDRKSESPDCILINQCSSAGDDKSITNESSEMWNVLSALNLHHYYENLVSEGFESLDYLKHTTFSDLLELGLKRGHARRLLRGMREYRANPSLYCRTKSRKLQERLSLSSLTSSNSSTNTLHSISISHSSIPENEQYLPNDSEHLLRIDDIKTDNKELTDREYSGRDFEGYLIRRRSNSFSFSDSSPSVIGSDKGYLDILFTRRPLGFGIMFPLSNRAMVSSILDEGLKIKGLCVGLPLQEIDGINIYEYTVDEVVNLLTWVKLPFIVTFSLTPYFKTGEKLMVLKHCKWNPCTIAKMSTKTRKVTVTYDGLPFKLGNTEKISNYSRIKQFDTAVPEIAQQLSPHNVTSQTLCSPKLFINRKPDVSMSSLLQKQSPVIYRGAVDKQSQRDEGNIKFFGRKRQQVRQQKKKTIKIIRVD